MTSLEWLEIRLILSSVNSKIKKKSVMMDGTNTHTGGQHFPSRPAPIRFLFPLHLSHLSLLPSSLILN
ncbi:hypothetical protein VN97_g2364 [Penicillium thymicola]|uniref:Uncharacterized protein n=1 Tax=Penicillium thymicola TaxID=293382 RepID=A0AAI9TP77_PENTH|nr:hypothetical protein VN97_g2364 [Penicillium thymicola]